MCEKIIWVNGVIKKIIIWNNYYFSIKFRSNIDFFIPGQFGRLKLIYKNLNIIRAYSYVNPPENKNLEFYIKKIDNGIASNILFNLQQNDIIKVSKKSYGNLIINNNTYNNYTLWMFATNTGIGPFISILKSKKTTLNNINNIILIYYVNKYSNINYIKSLKYIKKKLKTLISIIIISKYRNYYFNGNIINLFTKNKIKIFTNIKINYNDIFMICGNPIIINNLKKYFIKNNIIEEKKIIFEKYWK